MPTKPEISALTKRATPETYNRFRPLSQQRKCPCFWDNHKEAQIGVFRTDDGMWRFKCPKCDKGGDILSFIQEANRCTFPEALKLLREALGESAPSERPVSFDYNQGKAAARLHEVLGFLAARGIDEETARRNNVGAVDHPVLGLAVAMPYGKKSDKGVDIVKFRAVNPPRDENSRLIKFRHLTGASTDDQLYGWPMNVDSEHFLFDPYLWVVESELDKLTLESYGKNVISVGSATASLRKGELKYSQEVFDTLAALDIKVLIATDMDSAGNENAAAWLNKLPPHQVLRVKWPYMKGTPDKPSKDPKDIGDLFAKDSTGFHERIRTLEVEACNRPPLWREKFHTVDELPDGDIDFLIEEIVPEGVTFIGALSGLGKTWFAISMARALTTGTKFLGNWNVPKTVTVLYLCPEMNAKPFKRRCKKMGISERFYCQTVSDGVPIALDDPILTMAIRDLSPVVFLDTAIRFSDAEDENSASQNARGLAEDIKALQYMGARAIVCLHHRGKKDGESPDMTLENVLRGTGDFGAMCDAVWGLHHDRGKDKDPEYCKKSKRLVRLHVSCVKARDFEPPADFVIQLNEFLEKIGDFGILDQPAPGKSEGDERISLVEEVAINPKLSVRALETKTGIGRNRIPKLLKDAGWEYSPQNGWHKPGGTTGGTLGFEEVA